MALNVVFGAFFRFSGGGGGGGAVVLDMDVDVEEEEGEETLRFGVALREAGGEQDDAWLVGFDVFDVCTVLVCGCVFCCSCGECCCC